jgi:hypothetical protein
MFGIGLNIEILKAFPSLMNEKLVKSLIHGRNSKLFSLHPLAEALLNGPSCAICLKNLVSVFVLFHIVFSANDALGVEHSFAF